MDLKVLIIGAYGLLGSSLSKYLVQKGFKVYKASRSLSADYVINATNKKELNIQISNLKPDYVLNLCALTNVDYCENNPKEAFLINSEVPKKISSLTKDHNFKLIHISTDQIYAGKGPHIEENTDPLNIYAKSKLKGESFVLDNKGMVIRTNFVGKSQTCQRVSFTDWLIKKVNSNDNFQLFNDVIFNPLHILDLNDFIYFSCLNFRDGCFNVGSLKYISKADFALSFLKKLNYSINNIKICSIKESKLLARRPLDMSMNLQNLKKNFKWEIPDINTTIEKCIEEYK